MSPPLQSTPTTCTFSPGDTEGRGRLKRLLESIQAEREAWGLRERGGDVSLAADHFVEALVPEATILLNELTAATDTQRLPGAAGQPVAEIVDEPSAEWWHDMLSYEIRMRVRLMSGL